MASTKKTIALISLILILIGAFNWGLIGFFNLDVVSTIFGVGATVTKVIYGLVGLSAIGYLATMDKK